MAFRFEADEDVPTAVRRIVRERVDDAIERLQAPGEARHEGIHEARKRTKEIRAVLRLVRGELGSRFAEENRWYRDTARGLSEARDAQAVVESVEKLLERYPQRLRGKAIAAVRERLRERAAAGADGDGSAVTVALERLGEARERVASWPFKHDGFGALKPGLKRIYRQGRGNAEVAFNDGSDEAFHEWRKRVKDLWYHTTLLQNAWPGVMAARKRELKKLSDAIGDDHDLAVLRALIDDEPRTFGDKRVRDRLLGVMETRRRELRDEARSLGRLAYAEKPKPFTRRMAAYWRIWREAPV